MKAPGRSASKLPDAIDTSRGPVGAVEATVRFTTTVVSAGTVVELTVSPVPLKVTRVAPVVSCVLGDPVIVTVTVEPGAAVPTSRAAVITAIDRPALCSPVVRLVTSSAVVPVGKPAGTLTVRRCCVEVIARTEAAGVVTAAPAVGVNVTVLLAAAVVSKPVPIIVRVIPADAFPGDTDASVPACVDCNATQTSIKARWIGRIPWEAPAHLEREEAREIAAIHSYNRAFTPTIKKYRRPRLVRDSATDAVSVSFCFELSKYRTDAWFLNIESFQKLT